MKKAVIFFCFICIIGVEGMDWKYKTKMDNSIRQNILMGKIPSTDDIANEYVEIYNKDKDDSISLQSGILASQYFIKEKQIDKASNLLVSIVPTIFSLISSDFSRYFINRIRCAGKLISRYAKEKNITSDYIKTILNEN